MMLERFQPAVFACQSPQVNGEKIERGSSRLYPGWPEIGLPSTFYTFPTLCSLPSITCALYVPRNPYWGWEEAVTLDTSCLLMTPEHEARLPQIVEALNSNSSNTPSVQAFWRVSAKILGGGKVLSIKSREIAQKTRARGSPYPEWDAFAVLHDLGHYGAWSLVRQTTTKFNTLASAVFDLLKPATAAQCTNFWAEFRVCNGALVDYLGKALAFEELRATVFAFDTLDSDIRTSIESDIRQVMVEEGVLGLFEELAALTSGDWRTAWWLTILAEATDPEDPIQGFAVLRDGLTESKSRNWSPEQWSAWAEAVEGQIDAQEWKTDKAGWDVTFFGSIGKWLRIESSPNEGASGTVDYSALPDVQEAIFLESIRQQLAQIRGLICPFKRGRRVCCGFGNYLRAVWSQIPLQYRYPKFIKDRETAEKLSFRSPHKVCLNYGL